VLIQELTRQASLDLLARTHLGRLACAQGAQPYVVPVSFVYDKNSLYIFSTVGQKIEWMRANPLVCVEADEVVSPRQWVSVVVFGRYEELLDMPEWPGARAYAYKVLQQNAVWWEPAFVKMSYHDRQRPLVPVFYRIHVVRIIGHRATPDPVAPPDTRLSMTDSGEIGRLQKLLGQIRGKLKKPGVHRLPVVVTALARRDGMTERGGIDGPAPHHVGPSGPAVTHPLEGPKSPGPRVWQADAARAGEAMSGLL
jgi:nitroimidazol reductase NimA-like FMN-containing flavoprotein (pyridoxamine 5'-phosphate oxidase superfamily)